MGLCFGVPDIPEILFKQQLIALKEADSFVQRFCCCIVASASDDYLCALYGDDKVIRSQRDIDRRVTSVCAANQNFAILCRSGVPGQIKLFPACLIQGQLQAVGSLEQQRRGFFGIDDTVCRFPVRTNQRNFVFIAGGLPRLSPFRLLSVPIPPGNRNFRNSRKKQNRGSAAGYRSFSFCASFTVIRHSWIQILGSL